MERLLGEQWDVIVVGTGMGGSTIGHALAAQGRKLLFIERGRDLLATGVPALGTAAGGTAAARADVETHTPAARLALGLWPTPIRGVTNRGSIDDFPSLGCGTGGSTLLYAAQLERLFPADFEPRANFAAGGGDSTLPAAWPIRYDELLPHYEAAERLYRVCGTADPLAPGAAVALRAPPPLSARDAHFMDSFRQIGLAAYQAHVACDFIEGCVGCGGTICAAACKSDARRTCLAPALAQHGAHLLADCEVLALEADAERVHAVHVRWRGEERRIEAALFVLAAGALMTPRILLQSHSAAWPDGLANRSGLVGRNLMFHASDFAAVRPRQRLAGEGPQKAVAMNDFYQHGGEKLGAFQSIGIALDAGMVAGVLARRFARHGPAPWRRALRGLCRLAGLAIAARLRGAALFATVTEDLPYRDNRVLLDASAPSGMRFEYRYRAELDRRSRSLRRKLTDALRVRHRVLWLRWGHNLNLGHACGTCRFGDDPAASVLDRDNRAHGIDNLYVVDASFFPSSGGTNPSLTIAANALRVAQAIAQRWPLARSRRLDLDPAPAAPQ